MHRDLKPENILIDRYRRWRITDFGIAKGEDEPTGATGTPAFAAPEQLLGEPQGPAVDCFGIGGIVAFALTGEPPFSGRTRTSILARQLAGDYGAARFDAPVARFLQRALAARSARHASPMPPRCAKPGDLYDATMRRLDARSGAAGSTPDRCVSRTVLILTNSRSPHRPSSRP